MHLKCHWAGLVGDSIVTGGLWSGQVALPMAVTATGATATLAKDKHSLALALPYLPLVSHLKQVVPAPLPDITLLSHSHSCLMMP